MWTEVVLGLIAFSVFSFVISFIREMLFGTEEKKRRALVDKLYKAHQDQLQREWWQAEQQRKQYWADVHEFYRQQEIRRQHTSHVIPGGSGNKTSS